MKKASTHAHRALLHNVIYHSVYSKQYQLFHVSAVSPFIFIKFLNFIYIFCFTLSQPIIFFYIAILFYWHRYPFFVFLYSKVCKLDISNAPSIPLIYTIHHKPPSTPKKHPPFQVWSGSSNRCINTFTGAHDGYEVCSAVISDNSKVWVGMVVLKGYWF